MSEPAAAKLKSSRPRKIRHPVPQDAACLIIADRRGPQPKLLMGRRRPDQVFLPDVWVFPGGRVEPGDLIDAGRVRQQLSFLPLLGAGLRGSPAAESAQRLALALALAAVRETFEETGYLLADQATSWGEAISQGHIPALDQMAAIIRAITPPGRPRRYDTRFFLVDAAAIGHNSGTTDDEFTQTGWFTVDEVARLDIAGITRLLLSDIEAALLSKPSQTAMPFYRQVGRHYARTVLRCDAT